jgi:hypothetical protein
MRKDFAEAILTNADDNPTWVFITGDLGYMALENVEAKLYSREFKLNYIYDYNHLRD